MAGEREVKVTILGDAKGALRSIDQTESKLGGLSSKVGSFAKIAAAGFAVVGAGAVAFGAMSVKAASNFNETLSKSNTIFGEHGKAMDDWAKTASRSFGQSRQGALDAAATFGNMFTQLGIATPQAAEMSRQMTELASDFASFHNADITQVIDAQSAAFRGEYDALQRFVPTINAAAVEQKALAMTGKATTKELTLQEKALAVNALMMEGAGDAMGDFDRTSDSLANRQKILSAEFANMQVAIGQKLLPVAVAFAGWILSDAIPALEKFAEWIGPKVAAAVEFVQADVIPRIQAFIAFIVPILQELGRIIAEEFVKFRIYYESDIKPALDNIIIAVGAVIGYVREHWPEIERIVRPIMEQILLVIETTVKTIAQVIGLFLDVLQGDWSGAWERIKAIVDLQWELIKGTIGNAIEFILGILAAAIPALLDLGGRLIGALRDGIVGGISAVDAAVNSVAQTIRDAIEAVPGQMAAIGVAIVQGLANGIINAAPRIIGNAVSFLADQIPGPVKDFLGIGSPSKVMYEIGLDVGRGLALGIEESTPLVSSAVQEMNAAVANAHAWQNTLQIVTGQWEAQAKAQADRLALADKFLELNPMGTGLPTNPLALAEARYNVLNPYNQASIVARDPNDPFRQQVLRDYLTVNINVSGSVIATRDIETAVVQAVTTATARGRL